MSDKGRALGYRNVNGSGLSGNLKGALLMLVSGVGFTIYLLMNKLLSDDEFLAGFQSGDIHPIFLAFWRALFGMLLAVPFVLRKGIGSLRTKRPGLLLLRSLFGTLGFTLAIIAVSDFYTLTLAQFNAISFTRPLFVTLLAALVLGEYVGVHRWGAVFFGFIGVLVMVLPGVFMFWQPGAFSDVGFDTGSAVALTSAFTLAAAIVLVKFLSGELPAIALLFYANLFSTIILAPFVAFHWGVVPLEVWALILGMSLVGFISQFCYISAMSVGDASFLSPLDYLRLPLSAAADFAVFRLIPGLNVGLGALIIIVSTLYVGMRERRAGKRIKSSTLGL